MSFLTARVRHEEEKRTLSAVYRGAMTTRIFHVGKCLSFGKLGSEERNFRLGQATGLSNCCRVRKDSFSRLRQRDKHLGDSNYRSFGYGYGRKEIRDFLSLRVAV